MLKPDYYGNGVIDLFEWRQQNIVVADETRDCGEQEIGISISQ